MADFRTAAQTLLAKVEVTPGTDVSPVVGTDAVKVISPTVSQNLAVLESAEVTRALDAAARITGGGPGAMSFGAYLKGQGAGGSAPDFGPLLQGCAMAETLLAADDTGTAQAGTSSTIQLAAAAVTTDDEFIGMVIETTGGTGSGQTRMITDSVASTDTLTIYPDWSVDPDATTTYAIKACALYVPASSTLKNLTLYRYLHKTTAGNHILSPILGAAGNASLDITINNLPRLDFNFTGKIATPTDVSDPGAATYDATTVVPFNAANWYLGGVAIKARSFSLDLGASVQVADDPADTYGVDVAGVTTRRLSGKINAYTELLATRDVLAAVIAGTTVKNWIQWGATDGSRISIYNPSLRYTGREDADVDGFAGEGIPFDAQGDGDDGVYICVF